MGVVSLSADDAWIFGTKGFYQAYLERWDGTSWQEVQGANIGDGDSELDGIGLLPGGTVWAVGNFEPNGTDQPLLEVNPTP